MNTYKKIGTICLIGATADLALGLRTTRAQRTGCSMYGFGIHIEKRSYRLDRLRQDAPKEWYYWMYDCCTDSNGEKYGWGRVLNHIGVKWEGKLDEYNQLEL